MTRRVAPLVLAVTALFALTGCFKMDAELEVHSDDTISGTMIVALDKDVLAMMEDLGDDVDGSEGDGIDDIFGPEDVPDGATVEEYEDDEYVGQQMTFEDITLGELTESADSGEDEWSITHEGETYTFDGGMDLTDTDGGEAMLGELMQDADLRVSITFPGEVSDTNGDADGRTVVWTPKMGEKNDMHAVASEDGSSLLPALGSVALLGVFAVAGFVLYKRTGGTTSSATAPTVTTPEE